MSQTEFIGHLHPLIVHLPIGILLFAFVLMLFQRIQKVEIESAISLAFLLGAISATLACVAGWLLAQSGEYDEELIFKHQWTGIATAVFGFLAYFLKQYRWYLGITTTAILSIAGHYGGTLTHGEDYLFPKKKPISIRKESIDQPLTIQEINEKPDTVALIKNTIAEPTIKKTFVYQDVIVPILEQKCYKCHSETKKKGGLRLDTEAFIKAGGENGSIFLARNPEKSILFSQLLLPEDDEKHMPPKGKLQLTEREIASIHYWIKNGASFKEVVEIIAGNNSNKVTNQSANLVIPKLPEALLAYKQNVATENTQTSFVRNFQSAETKILALKTELVSPALLAQLKQKNIVMSNFGEKSNYMMANFVNVKDFNSSMIDDLKQVNNQLIRLKLSNLPVNDDDVKSLVTFKNLTRLNLDKTAITDAALVHLKSLSNLEQLNLYGTNITDKGLTDLAKCSNLKVVYLWQTKVTEEGIEKLKKTLPNIQIEMGGFRFSKPDSSKNIKL